MATMCLEDMTSKPECIKEACSRDEEASILEDSKTFAVEKGIPVLTATQANRSAENDR